MERRAFLGASFGEREGSRIEMKRGKSAPAVRDDATIHPVQAARDHEMDHEPEIIVETNGDAFAHTPRRSDGAAVRLLNRRRCRAQQKRPCDLTLIEDTSQDASLKSFEINDDVWQLRHLA